MSNNHPIITVHGGVAYFYANDTALSPTVAKEIAVELQSTLTSGAVHLLVVNQMNLHQDLTTAEDKAWIELYRNLPHEIYKSATICQNIVHKLQTNYVFKMEGVSDRFKAFVPEESDEMCRFLDVESVTIEEDPYRKLSE